MTKRSKISSDGHVNIQCDYCDRIYSGTDATASRLMNMHNKKSHNIVTHLENQGVTGYVRQDIGTPIELTNNTRIFKSCNR